MILILLGHDFQQNGVLPSKGPQGTVVNSLRTTDNDNHTGHRSVLNFVTMINAVRFNEPEEKENHNHVHKLLHLLFCEVPFKISPRV